MNVNESAQNVNEKLIKFTARTWVQICTAHKFANESEAKMSKLKFTFPNYFVTHFQQTAILLLSPMPLICIMYR